MASRTASAILLTPRLGAGGDYLWQVLESRLRTCSVSGAGLYCSLDWPSDVYFENPSTEFVEVHVVDRVLGICSKGVRDERKATVLGL